VVDDVPETMGKLATIQINSSEIGMDRRESSKLGLEGSICLGRRGFIQDENHVGGTGIACLVF
jgi:hypothetical protein